MSERQMKMIEEIKRRTGVMTVSMVIANAILCYYNSLIEQKNAK